MSYMPRGHRPGPSPTRWLQLNIDVAGVAPDKVAIRYLTHPTQCTIIQAWKRKMLTFKLSCAGPMQSVDPT